jgi:hypothetical protein
MENLSRLCNLRKDFHDENFLPTLITGTYMNYCIISRVLLTCNGFNPDPNPAFPYVNQDLDQGSHQSSADPDLDFLSSFAVSKSDF